MSVDKTHYVLLGLKINSIDDYWNEKYLPYIEGHPDVEYRLIVDQMSGEYAFFGKVLAFGGKYEGIPVTEINIYDIIDIREQSKILDKAEELFIKKFSTEDINLYAFTDKF